MTFKCKRCGYESEHKHCLYKHFNRKKGCNAILDDIEINILLSELDDTSKTVGDFECVFCKRRFVNRNNMYKHKKICKKKIDQNSLQEQINELRDYIKNIPTIQNNNTTNNQQNNTTNNQQINNINLSIPNIKLRDFGKENMEAVPESLVSSLFMDLRFRELLANLHCDPNFPENQNIRIKSAKRNMMEIFRNNKWDIVTFTSGLTELLLQGHKIFKTYYEKDKERIIEEDMSEEEIKEALNQLDKIEKLNKEELRPLLLDLQMMLEEYRSNGHAIVLA